MGVVNWVGGAAVLSNGVGMYAGSGVKFRVVVDVGSAMFVVASNVMMIVSRQQR